MATGLRQRKKQELRDQLSLATLQLAKERGLAKVRVEDIVDRVGVSRRTFNNYFASKEDAIVDRHLQRIQRSSEALRQRPAGEPLWEALAEVMVEPFRGWSGALEPQGVQESLNVVLGEPSLQAAIARGSQVAQQQLAQAVAERTGTDPDQDLYPQLVSAAVITAQLLALDFWVRAAPPVTLERLLLDAFAQLRAGLDAPLQPR